MRSTVICLVLGAVMFGQSNAVWSPDQGDGSFINPIIHADYSDPDAVRVGLDYFMVSSSFSAVPGLPILHSKDLVNWALVNHALPRLVPEANFSTPRHGAGVWAPAIRFHAGRYWIYYPDPDYGIYVITATDPRGQWSAPVLVKAGRGLIDPCPLWDDDGSVYLIHAFARSRAGFANVLHLARLTPDGTAVAEPGRIIIDGDTLPGYTTLEGPKLYKRNGWYYVFAPAGGVKQGWQSVFRSRRIDGPYEGRIVLAQGTSDVNGPHQGALVDTPGGQWWFLHFQDAEAYGRVVHLQPVAWKDDWPVIGDDADRDGTGEPRRVWNKPALPRATPMAPRSSDTFQATQLGLQWQWQANPQHWWWDLDPGAGLRLRAVPSEGNLWQAAHLLMQKWPAPAFSATAQVDVSMLQPGERAGLIVFGADYAWIGIERGEGPHRVVVRALEKAAEGGEEKELAGIDAPPGHVTLRVSVAPGGVFTFAAGDARHMTALGPAFTAKPGRWVGAKVGLFAAAPATRRQTGHVTVRSFDVGR
jgi:beta-xylosidase